MPFIYVRKGEQPTPGHRYWFAFQPGEAEVIRLQGFDRNFPQDPEIKKVKEENIKRCSLNPTYLCDVLKGED